MESVLGRYRNLIVLVTVLFAQVLGLAVQVKRTSDSEPTRLIRVWAVGAVTPFEEGLHWLQASTSGIWHNYLYLRGVRAENRDLKQQIQQMRLEQARMSQDAEQAHRLQALFEFKEQFISQTTAAQVIGWSGSEQSRSIYIDKGAREGIKPDMAVITRDGIIGKVLQVFGTNPLERSVSQVLLINDQTSGVGAILDQARLQGILRGTPSGDVVLEKVMSDEAVPVGEMVLTSGGDGIFPKGLPVGKVTKVTPGSELFLNIRVRPAANLSRLEEVLVVTKIDERQAQPEQAGPVRAVDILAERLPTVPPKQDAAVQGTDKTAAGQPGAAAPSAAAPNPATPNPATPKNGLPQAAGSSGGAAGADVPGTATTAAKKAASAASSIAPPSVTPSSVVPASTTPRATRPAIPAKPVTKPVQSKPVNSTTTPKPQPAVEDTPQ